MDCHMTMAILLSAAIGVSLGLLGGGGSVLAVPVLVYVAGVEAKEAVTMSLAIVGSTSLVASLLHQRQGNLDFKVAATFGSAGVAGAFLGAKLTALVSGSVLLLIFAALMLIVGALMLVRKKNEPSPTDEKRRRNPTKTLLVGAGVGVVTGFLGVGGGFLTTPLLIFYGIPPTVAAASASATAEDAGSVFERLAGAGGDLRVAEGDGDVAPEVGRAPRRGLRALSATQPPQQPRAPQRAVEQEEREEGGTV